MTERVTSNLPSSDFDNTAEFYRALGFRVQFQDEGWMIISRGSLEIEFFPLDLDPRKSCFSACIRVDDLDGLYASFQGANLPSESQNIPRLVPPQTHQGLRMFVLVDRDGNLLRCIQNRKLNER